MALRSWPAVLVVVWGVAALSAVSASAAEVSGGGEAAAAVAAAAFCAAGSAVATADLADLDAARPAALRLRPEALVVAPGVAARGAAFSAAAAAAGAPSGAADEAVSLDAGFGAVAALCPVAISAADVFLRLVVRVVRRFWGDSSVAGGVSGVSVGAAVAAARRGGLSSTFDELNKFFTISGMPVASSQYWNSIHGRLPGEAAQDAGGLQTMRTLARNMAFLVKSIALGREKYGLPEREEPLRTHFIR